MAHSLGQHFKMKTILPYNREQYKAIEMTACMCQGCIFIFPRASQSRNIKKAIITLQMSNQLVIPLKQLNKFVFIEGMFDFKKITNFSLDASFNTSTVRSLKQALHAPHQPLVMHT